MKRRLSVCSVFRRWNFQWNEQNLQFPIKRIVAWWFHTRVLRRAARLASQGKKSWNHCASLYFWWSGASRVRAKRDHCYGGNKLFDVQFFAFCWFTPKSFSAVGGAASKTCVDRAMKSDHRSICSPGRQAMQLWSRTKIEKTKAENLLFAACLWREVRWVVAAEINQTFGILDVH